jgi:voltage-gated potassium channel Kch
MFNLFSTLHEALKIKLINPLIYRPAYNIDRFSRITGNGRGRGSWRGDVTRFPTHTLATLGVDAFSDTPHSELLLAEASELPASTTTKLDPHYRVTEAPVSTGVNSPRTAGTRGYVPRAE